MREDVMLHFLDATYFKRRESPSWASLRFSGNNKIILGVGERESGELLIRGNAAVGGWGQD